MMKNRTSTSGSSPRSQDFELRCSFATVPNKCWLCRGEGNRVLNVTGAIYGRMWVLWLMKNGGVKVAHRVGEIVSNKIRPAEITGLFGLVYFIMTRWSMITLFMGIRANITPVQGSGLLINIDSPRVSATHNENFRMAFGSILGEEVSIGNFYASNVCGADS